MTEHHGPEQVTRAEFDSNIVGGKGVVVVDIWAEWCTPCRMLAPALHKLAAEHADRVHIVKLCFDDNLDLQEKYGFEGIPALLLFNDGQLVDKIVGYQGYSFLRELFLAFMEQVTGEEASAPSALEEAFIAAERAAELAHDEAYVRDVQPVRAEFVRVFQRANRNAKRTITRAEKAFKAGKIDEVEKARRVKQANKRLQTVIETSGAAYHEASAKITQPYIRAVEVAAGIFVASHSANVEGKFCEIGDTTCKV